MLFNLDIENIERFLQIRFYQNLKKIKISISAQNYIRNKSKQNKLNQSK